MPDYSNPNGESLEMAIPLQPGNPLNPFSNHPVRDRMANI